MLHAAYMKKKHEHFSDSLTAYNDREVGLCTLWAQALKHSLKVGKSSWRSLEDWRASSDRVGFVHPREIYLNFILTPKCAISLYFKTSAEINPYFLNLSSG